MRACLLLVEVIRKMVENTGESETVDHDRFNPRMRI